MSGVHDLLTPTETVAFLKDQGYTVGEGSLATWRTVGGGPVFQKVGRHVYYTPLRLREFVASKTRELRKTGEVVTPSEHFVAQATMQAGASL
jgi:hypothetical protein